MPNHTLPLEALEWTIFQKFCTDLLLIESDSVDAREYLKSGSKQGGIDIYVSKNGSEKLTVAQCKKKEYISPKELDEIIDLFLTGKFSYQSNEFILCTSFDFSSKKNHEEKLEQIRNQLRENNIDLKVWDLEGINSHLRTNASQAHIAVVYRYFRHENTLDFYGAAYTSYINTLNLPKRNKYKFEVLNYIARKVEFKSTPEQGELSTLSAYIKSELNKSATPIQILLTAPAGVGKSVELQYISHQLSSDNTDIYPLCMDLRDYNGEELETFLFSSEEKLKNVPNHQLFLILDGLDEVSIDKYVTSTKKINSFLQRKDANILISARSNFIDVGTPSIRNVKVCVLNNLTKADINHHIKNELGEEDDLFKSAVKKYGFDDYLTIPFYLINLIELYKINNRTFSTSRRNLLKDILLKNLAMDKFKYSNEELVDEIFILAKNIAFSISVLGKTVITTKEMQNLGYNKTKIDELDRLSILKKDKSSISDDNWSFQHKNIQEYLTAEVLANSKNIEQVLDILFIDERSKTQVNPRMLNTLSFLISNESLQMEVRGAIIDKLISQDPESLVNFEKDKIPAKLRDELFYKVWEIYKSKGLSLYTANRFKLEDFAEFSAIDKKKTLFLLEELQIGLNMNLIDDALNLIALNPKKYLVKDDIKNKLHSLLYGDLYPTPVKGTILTTLYFCKILTENNFNDYLTSGLDIKNYDIRAPLLKIIRWGNYKEYGTFILDSIEIFETDKQKINNSSVSYYIKNTLCNLKGAGDIIEILKYLVNNPQRIDLYHGSEKIVFENHELNKIFTNAATIANDDTKIAVMVYKLMRKLEHIEHEWPIFNLFISFFHDLGISHIIFEKLQRWTNNVHLSSPFISINNLHYLEDLANEGTDGRQKAINLLNLCFHQNERLFDEIKNKWENIDGFVFPTFQKSKTQQELADEANLKNQKLLVNQNLFLQEVKDIFQVIGKDGVIDWTSLYKKPGIVSYNDSIALTEILRENKKKEIKLKEIIDKYSDKDMWQRFKIKMIISMLNDRNRRTSIDTQLIKYAEGWCLQMLLTLDFHNMFNEKEDGSYTVNSKKNDVIQIYRELRFKIKDELYLKLLVAENYLNHSNKKSLTRVIVDNISSIEELKKTVIWNIRNSKLASTALMNHFQICEELKIKEGLELIYSCIKEKKITKPDFLVELSNIYINLGGDHSDLLETEEISEKLKNGTAGEYDWFLFEKETESDSKWTTALLEALTQKINSFVLHHQIRIINNLILTGNTKGLDLWIEKSIAHNKDILSERRNQLIEKGIRNINAIDAINSLSSGLEKIYKKGLHIGYDHFESIYLAVTNLLGIPTENDSDIFEYLQKKLNELKIHFNNKTIEEDINYQIDRCTDHYFRTKKDGYSFEQVKKLLSDFTTAG